MMKWPRFFCDDPGLDSNFTYLAAFFIASSISLSNQSCAMKSVWLNCTGIQYRLQQVRWLYDSIHVAVLALSSASSILDISANFIFLLFKSCTLNLALDF